jgi:hypothetical protein
MHGGGSRYGAHAFLVSPLGGELLLPPAARTGAMENTDVQPPPWSPSHIFWDALAMQALAAPLLAAGAAAAEEPALAPLAFVAADAQTPRLPRVKTPRARRAHPVSGCMVPGCVADLQAQGSYHLRNRLCVEHMRAEELSLPEGAQRFCQARRAACARQAAA